MSQLAELLLLITEVHGSNPVIGKIYAEHVLLLAVQKTKEARNGHKNSLRS